jgi:hypothetical protein
MADTMESDFEDILVKVVLPSNIDTTINEALTKNRLIRAEKERILKNNKIPFPVMYVMVLHGPHGSSKVLSDSDMVKDCLDLQEGVEAVIRIEKKDSQVERPPRSSKPELLNYQLKQPPA